LLSAAEERLIASLVDEEAIEKASLNNRAYAFQQPHNARRLEQGKSNLNVGLLGRLVLAAEETLGVEPTTRSSGQAVSDEHAGDR
jgi:hypothetical protein